MIRAGALASSYIGRKQLPEGTCMRSTMLARLMVHAGHAADEEAAVDKLQRLFARRFPGRSFDDFDTLVSPEMVRRYVLSLGLPEATTRPGLI